MVLDEIRSLEESCLSTIVANFDLFMMDYRSSEPRFSKSYEFLQRTYSDTLMAKLIEKGKLQDEHLYFLINPYIKKLHFEKSTVNPQIVIERLKVVGSAVTSLNLSSTEWTRRAIKQLVPLMPMLRVLDLSNRKCSDEVLKQVARNCPHLEVLDVTNNNVTIEGLKHFFKNENGYIDNTTLKELRISNTHVVPIELEFILDRCLSLTILDHSGLSEIICFRHMTDFLINAIDSLPQYNLTTLGLPVLSAYQPSDVLNLCAVVCPNINILRIARLYTEEDITACARFKNITDFEVYDVSSSDIHSLTSFIELRGYNLQRYKQHCGKISAAKLCECCPKLKELILWDVEFENNVKSRGSQEDSNIYTLPMLVKLCVQHVIFTQPSVTDSVNLLVLSCPNLEILDLSHNDKFTDSIVNSITHSHCFITTLRKFDVSYSNFNARLSRKILQRAPRLETLVVSYTTITEEEYVELNNVWHVNVNRGVNIIWENQNIDYDDYYDNDIGYISDSDYILDYY